MTRRDGAAWRCRQARDVGAGTGQRCGAAPGGRHQHHRIPRGHQSSSDLDPPYKHARHYTHSAEPGNLHARLAAHAAGTGALLIQVIREAGRHFPPGPHLARWPHPRTGTEKPPRRAPAVRHLDRAPHASATQRHRPPAAGTHADARAAAAPASPLAYECGAAQARQTVQQQIDAGFSADQIAKAQARILSALVRERLRPEGREEARGSLPAAGGRPVGTCSPPTLLRRSQHVVRFWPSRGQHHDALAMGREALVLCRSLHTVYPGAFRNDLINALSNLLIDLRNLNRNDEAEQTEQELTMLTGEPNNR